MSISYVQKNKNSVQTKSERFVSIIDSSSQSESLQRKADMVNNAAQRAEAPRPNNTGMPDNLKSGIESLSGFSMDDVRVHYNSSKPATVQALAYTQGTDIHVAPGQEKHLPHEAWHVAQQMAGRVSPTTNINGMPVNDNAALEHEADVMGEKAVGQRIVDGKTSLKSQKNTVFCSQMFFGEDTYNDGNAVFNSCFILRKSKEKERWDFLYGLQEDAVKKNYLLYCARLIKNLNLFFKENDAGYYHIDEEIFEQGRRAIKKVRNKIKRFIMDEEQKKGIKAESNRHFQKMCDEAIEMCRNVSDEKLEIWFKTKEFGKVRFNYNKIIHGLNIIKVNNLYVNTYIGDLDFFDRNGFSFYAYVKPKQKYGNHTGMIRLKRLYRQANEDGMFSKPGMLIHEVSHIAIKTLDKAYGDVDCGGLNADVAIKNADTYRLAAEESALPPPLPPRTVKDQLHVD